MNRIYQGRIQSAEKKLDEGRAQGLSRDDLRSIDSAKNPVFRHHEIFQDAINYYLVALGALADVPSDGNEKMGRLIQDLRSQLAKSWDSFPRPSVDSRKPKPRSLGESVRGTLGLKSGASLQDAFAAVLSGNEATAEARLLALALLLNKCSGDAAIQQGGRGYLPRFVDPKNDPTWDFSPEAIAAEGGRQELARILNNDPSEDELSEVATRMQLSWVVKVSPGKFFVGDEARTRLVEGVEHLAKFLESSEPGSRVEEAVAKFVEPQSQIQDLKAQVAALPNELSIPRNRKASKDLTFAALLFQFFPSDLTATILQLFLAKPKSTDGEDAAAEGIDFAQLGDDPIRLARGKRGYVFLAFTALKNWEPESAGELAWKEFDIAAFKEALKSLNQFSQQTEVKVEAQKLLQARYEYMTGVCETWTKPKTSAEEEAESHPVRLAGDERFELAKELREELGADLPDGTWGFTPSALRGFYKIREQWMKLPLTASQDDLETVVKEFKKTNRDNIGSVILFLALCQEKWRPIWRDEPPADKLPRAANLLSAMCELNQLERDFERKSQPVNLTPAEPFHSRRLYMFSDLTGRSAPKIQTFAADGKLTVEVSIAAETNGRLQEQRISLQASAPRLSRDQLMGDSSSRWLQPMMEALELGTKPPETTDFASAIALMPQLERGSSSHNPTVALLLNFPVTLDSAWITEEIGKAAIWKNQFNGTKDRSLHLHWPGTATPACMKAPWWEHEEVLARGFTALSYDFGQRTAGAWAIISASTDRPQVQRKIHEIGSSGNANWFADVSRTGMTRLPGEGTDDSRGRKASGSETADAIAWIQQMGIGKEDSEKAKAWISGKTFPEQNDALLTVAQRRLSRLNTYHRWSCVADVPSRLELIEKEVAAYEDHQDWSALLKAGEADAFADQAGNAFEALRAELEALLPKIANRTVPLRRQKWVWELQHADSDEAWKCLRIEEDSSELAKIKSQRGLSFRRLEQLEKLRKLFQRLNRSLNRTAGEAVKWGRDAEGESPGEPCPDLLEKLDRMKEERVNLTAHLMLAQALGLRLKSASDRTAQNPHLHGEYEKIPRRSPVDFIIIEDLERYRFSQGRAPSENSRLMKWSHRAVRDKLVMLCEPFGIPVVEVPPSYSSKVCSETGRPGFRCREISPNQGLPKNMRGKDKKHWEKLAQQLGELKSADLQRSLVAPKPGGPLFIAVGRDNAKNYLPGPVRQADINAAINIGLRGIAAPEAIQIHSKIRCEPKKGQLHPVRKNKREKAAFDSKSIISPIDDLSEEISKQQSVNVFIDPDGIADFDRVVISGIEVPAATGRGVWKTVNDRQWEICERINEIRIKKADSIPM